MRLSANVSILFPNLPLIERFGAAARAGFDAVEFWWPNDELEAGITEDDIARAVLRAGMSVVMLNFDGGDLRAGDRGLAGDPAGADRFRENVPRALALADRLGCRSLNAPAAKAAPGVPVERCLETLVDSLSFAADRAALQGARVLLEPLNTVETPGYLVPDVPASLGLIERVDRPNVLVQLDVYHVAMAGAEVVAAIHLAAGRIGHVQLADVPGRHEPWTGGLAFDPIIRALAEVGYAGALGLEYIPTTPEAPDFGYLARLRKLAGTTS